MEFNQYCQYRSTTKTADYFSESTQTFDGAWVKGFNSNTVYYVTFEAGSTKSLLIQRTDSVTVPTATSAPYVVKETNTSNTSGSQTVDFVMPSRPTQTHLYVREGPHLTVSNTKIYKVTNLLPTINTQQNMGESVSIVRIGIQAPPLTTFILNESLFKINRTGRLELDLTGINLNFVGTVTDPSKNGSFSIDFKY